jgi:hypothetical protein
LSTGEIARGTEGALRFLKRDPSAPLFFDNTIAACLRSFRVMALVAPFYVLYAVIYYTDVQVEAEAWEIALVWAMRYVVDWLLFPVLFFEIARHRHWLDRYPRYIAALNWMGLPAMAVLLVDAGLALVMPPDLQVVVGLAVQAFLFYWFLTITRVCLGVSWPLASLLLIVDYVPSVFLSLLVDRVLGVNALPG